MPDCAEAAEHPDTHCLTHIIAIREELGERACRDNRSRCIRPRFGRAIRCREHFQQDAFGGEIHNGQQPPPRYRRAAAAAHLRPVRGLDISYVIYSDPGHPSQYNPGTVVHQIDAERQRLYLYAYIDGGDAGHLSAWLHPGGTICIRKIEVRSEYQRQGIASALYETLRAEHPGTLIDHGMQSDDAKVCWAGYCAARNLNPRDPRS